MGRVGNVTPRPLYPRDRDPVLRGWVGLKGRSGRVWKISPLPGFDPRTVQPVTIRYTDWAVIFTGADCGNSLWYDDNSNDGDYIPGDNNCM
jgi:hypothetical protein